jgi:CHASE2 domain-containing sensor protein
MPPPDLRGEHDPRPGAPAVAGSGRRQRALALAGALGVLVAFIVALTERFDSLEGESIDARFELRGEREAPSDVVIVAIDQRSLLELEEPYPFPARLHRRAIDQLTKAGARVVAYDIPFGARTGAAETAALADAIDDAPPIVFAADPSAGLSGREVLADGPTLESVGAGVGCVEIDFDEGGGARQLLESCKASRR